MDVSLHVRRGEAVGLLGPNGAGKTTVFYMITGLVPADQGTIHLDGFNITALPMYRRARLGNRLSAAGSLDLSRALNVEDNIRAVLEADGAATARPARISELESLLEEFDDQAPAEIALDRTLGRRAPPLRNRPRARGAHPSFMLLDEPFAGIDPIAVGDIQNLVHAPEISAESAC